MESRPLGRSGLRVSRLGLGTMTWGAATDEYDALDQLRAFLDAGGTLVDTADVYADGASEEVLGHLISELGVRDSIVLATKAVSLRRSTRRFDASRAQTPLDETLAAVDDAVRSGRVRYAGVSNYSGWQTAQAATMQSAAGHAPLISTQVEYSLLQRGIEREVVPACDALGIGILPWSPLGRGVLTGKYRNGIPADSRAATDDYGSFTGEYLTPHHGRVVDSVATAAAGLNSTPLEVALAWVRDRPGVVAPIVGARTAAQLRAALTSEELELPAGIVAALDEGSAPARSYPEWGWNQR